METLTPQLPLPQKLPFPLRPILNINVNGPCKERGIGLLTHYDIKDTTKSMESRMSPPNDD